MLTIGHRGLKDEYPENTVTAVREAANHVDVVEVDVRPCGSAELVAAHDDELAGITGGEGRISETSLDSLRAETGRGDASPVPPFRAVLEAWPRGTGLNVDLKGDASVEGVQSLVADAAIDGPVIVSAEESAIESVDTASVDAQVGLSFWRDHVENVQRATDLGCEYVHVYHGLCLETDVVERAHEAGLAVDAWSIDDAETAERLAAVGVDAVTVNTRDAIP